MSSSRSVTRRIYNSSGIVSKLPFASIYAYDKSLSGSFFSFCWRTPDIPCLLFWTYTSLTNSSLNTFWNSSHESFKKSRVASNWSDNSFFPCCISLRKNGPISALLELPRIPIESLFAISPVCLVLLLIASIYLNSVDCDILLSHDCILGNAAL